MIAVSKFSILFSQSYFAKIKAKSFLITTALMLIGMAAIFMWPTISGWFSSDDEPLDVAVIDRTGMQAVSMLQDSGRLRFNAFKGDPGRADREVTDGKRAGVLVLDQTNDGRLSAEIRTAEPLKLNDQQVLESQLQAANQLFTIRQMNLNQDQAERILTAELSVDETLIGDQDAGKSSETKQTAVLISYGLAFLIYLFVISYLSMISSEIAAEKDSRIMELIISSVSPVTHLLSRLAGVLALGFTQIAVLIGGALLMAYFMNDGKYWDQVGEWFSRLPGSYLTYALLFAVLACVLYALIGAVLGSLVNKVQDVGQSVTPVIFIIMIGFFVAVSGMENPDSLLIVICSYIPFTSSMIMPMRIGATDIAYWEPVLSLLLLAVTIVALFLFSLRFYRGSVLTYTSGSFVKKVKQAMSLSR